MHRRGPGHRHAGGAHLIGPRRPGRALAALAVLLLLPGCSEPEPAPAPPPAPEPPAPPPNPGPPEPPVEDDIAEPDATPRPARFLLRAPDDVTTLERATLRPLQASVRVGEAVVQEELPVKLLAEAREGQAVMVLTVGRPPSSAEQWVAEILFNSLGPRDRVAVGNVSSAGFELVRGFSADTRSALAYLKNLRGAQPDEAPVGLLKGIHAALDAFRGQTHIPTLRALVLVSDGRDPTLKRSSVTEQILGAIRLRAYLHGVRIHAVVLGDDADAQRLQALARSTGGEAATADPEAPPTLSAAARTVANSLQRWVAIDANLGGLTPGSHTVTVAIHGAGERSRTRPIELPERGLELTWDMEVPPPPERVMPVGVESAKAVLAAARRAEQANDLLRAGALWHLALQANPESRAALTKTRTMNERHRKAPSGWGVVHHNGAPLLVDVRVRQQTDLAADLWRKDLRRETPLSRVIGPMPDPAEDGAAPAPPQSQIVLHRCQAHDARDCLRRLLAEGRATHLFIDAAGEVTQVVDLARPLGDPFLRTPWAVHVHLAAPPDPAVVWQDLDHPKTLRHVRRQVTGVEVNDVEVDGFDLTTAQYVALIPLLKGLTDHFPEALPGLPADARRAPTRRALVKPEAFNGVLLYSNVDHSVVRDPTPALRLAYLHDRMGRWSWRGESADMESWLPDLAEPRKQEAAALRFAHVGKVALPLLAEVALELDPEPARWAVEALSLIGDPSAEPTLLTLLKRPLPSPPGEGETNLRLAVVAALVRIGASSSVALAAADAALSQTAAVLPGSDAARTLARWVAALHLGAGAKGEPGLVARSGDPDPVVRGQAILGLAALSPDHEAVKRALTDAHPWIRLIVARALGQADALAALGDQVGREWATRALASLKRPTIPREVWGWVTDPDPVTRLVVSDLLIAHGGVEVVRALAPRLPTLDDAGRVAVLRTLRGITGRDFGSAPDGYMTWRP